jgi:hypothetical protein
VVAGDRRKRTFERDQLFDAKSTTALEADDPC